MGYLIEPNTKGIVTAKVTLTSANLLTPGYIIVIPNFIATPNYFWNTLSVVGEIITDIGSAVYTGTSDIHLQCTNGTAPLYRFGGTYMQNIRGTFAPAVISQANNIKYSVNDTLEIHNPGTLLNGTTGLNIYVTAILIKY